MSDLYNAYVTEYKDGNPVSESRTALEHATSDEVNSFADSYFDRNDLGNDICIDIVECD